MNASPDLLSTALKMFFALGATIGLLLLLFKFTKGFIGNNTGKTGQGMIRVVTTGCSLIVKPSDIKEV